jgi:hypothetical protein
MSFSSNLYPGQLSQHPHVPEQVESVAGQELLEDEEELELLEEEEDDELLKEELEELDDASLLPLPLVQLQITGK